MTPLSALWFPIVLSAVIVFVASSIIHMLLPYHRSDYQKLPDEEKLLPVLRAAGLKRGLYVFPFCTHKEMKSPAIIEKYNQGPVGMMTVFPNGPPAMPKFLGLWFGYCLVISIVVAHLAAYTVYPYVTHRHIFRVVGESAFLAYGTGKSQQQHLEGSNLEHDDQGSDRWPDLCSSDRRHVRLALAALDHSEASREAARMQPTAQAMGSKRC